MAYDEKGNKVWECELDIYAKAKEETGQINLVTIRYQGMYFDEETELCYNRHRYYDSSTGTFISSDPISIEGGFNVYAYVHDSNVWVDPFGLAPIPKKVLEALDAHLAKVNPTGAKKGVYEFIEKVSKYAGSGGTRKDTSTIRDRLMVHLRKGKLLSKNIKSTTIKAMDKALDQKV